MAGSTTQTHRIQGKEIVFERVFDAPRELVFKAFSSCEHLKQWWGPRAWPTTYCTIDFREGGRWHYCMTGPEGAESWGIGLFSKIDEPERIEYKDAFSDAEGNYDAEKTTDIIVEFTDLGGGKTKLMTTAVFVTEADLKAGAEGGMIEGFTETWDRLEEFVAGQK